MANLDVSTAHLAERCEKVLINLYKKFGSEAIRLTQYHAQEEGDPYDAEFLVYKPFVSDVQVKYRGKGRQDWCFSTLEEMVPQLTRLTAEVAEFAATADESAEVLDDELSKLLKDGA